MALFPLFKKPPFFTEVEKQRIVQAIRDAEHRTSGEIRVFVESKNSYVEPMDRAAEVFYNLEMDETMNRNAVLFYFAMVHKELALFADEGIYKVVGEAFWNNAVKDMISHFKGEDICNGIVNCIHQIGETLKEKFPFEASTDKNELPDDIVFGK